jgi:hypothetical protein
MPRERKSPLAGVAQRAEPLTRSLRLLAPTTSPCISRTGCDEGPRARRAERRAKGLQGHESSNAGGRAALSSLGLRARRRRAECVQGFWFGGVWAMTGAIIWLECLHCNPRRRRPAARRARPAYRPSPAPSLSSFPPPSISIIVIAIAAHARHHRRSWQWRRWLYPSATSARPSVRLRVLCSRASLRPRHICSMQTTWHRTIR